MFFKVRYHYIGGEEEALYAEAHCASCACDATFQARKIAGDLDFVVTEEIRDLSPDEQAERQWLRRAEEGMLV